MLDIKPGRLSPDHSALEQHRASRLAVIAFCCIVAILVGVLVMSKFVVLDRIVVGRGVLVTTVPTTSIRPFQTTLVEAVLVHPGQLVRRGQLLVRFERNIDTDSLHALQQKERLMASEIARLKLEVAAGPGNFISEVPPSDVQARLMADRQQSRRSKGEEFEAQSDAQNAGRRAQDVVTSVDRKTLSLEISRLADLRQLYNEGYYSRQNLLQQEEKVLADRALVERDVAATIESRNQLAALAARHKAADADDHASAVADLVSRSKEMHDVQGEIAKQQDLLALADVRAPFDAYILDVAPQDRTTIASATPIVTLVPAASPLQAEVYIENRDVTHVRQGTRVRLKVDALPFERHGYIEGHVNAIVREAIDGRGSESAKNNNSIQADRANQFRLIVTLDRRRLRDPSNPDLFPGMSIAADMRVGTQTIISYFLDPIVHNATGALTEPD